MAIKLPKLLIFRSFQHGLIEDFFWNTLSVFVMFFVDFFCYVSFSQIALIMIPSVREKINGMLSDSVYNRAI